MKSRRRKMSRDKRNGQYTVRIQVGGVRKYFPLGTSRKKAAVELTRLEKLHASGELDFQAAMEEAPPEPLAVEPAGDEITLRELTDVHLEWVLANRKPGTYELRERYLLAFLRYAKDRPVACAPRVDATNPQPVGNHSVRPFPPSSAHAPSAETPQPSLRSSLTAPPQNRPARRALP